MKDKEPPKQAATKKGVVESSEPDSTIHILGAKSLGVQRIEAVSVQFTGVDRIILFCSIFLVSYAYSLDGTIRYTYQVCDFFYSKDAKTDENLIISLWLPQDLDTIVF